MRGQKHRIMELNKALDEAYMREALKEARMAFDADEVPIGAVMVCKGKIIAKAHNLTERLNDFTAHAEMQAFTSASDYLGGKYLDDCTLYVTLEPCMMCGGAAFWTKLGRIVYGASDEKRGVGRFREEVLHPKTLVTADVLAEESSAMLKEYFKGKR